MAQLFPPAWHPTPASERQVPHGELDPILKSSFVVVRESHTAVQWLQRHGRRMSSGHSRESKRGDGRHPSQDFEAETRRTSGSKRGAFRKVDKHEDDVIHGEQRPSSHPGFFGDSTSLSDSASRHLSTLFYDATSPRIAQQHGWIEHERIQWKLRFGAETHGTDATCPDSSCSHHVTLASQRRQAAASRWTQSVRQALPTGSSSALGFVKWPSHVSPTSDEWQVGATLADEAHRSGLR